MTALLRAETERLLSRRITRFFPLSLALLMIVGTVIGFFAAGSDGPDFVGDLAVGVHGGPDDNSTLVLGPMGFLVPILGFVIGASYIGADLKSGMIEQILTWEPRRSRLLFGRLLGGLATLFAITTMLSILLVVLLYSLSSLTGSVDGALEIWPSVLGAVVRSAITGSMFFALGLASTVITNRSETSIVGFLIYVFVLDTALLQPLLPKVSRWLPMENTDAFVSRNGVGQGGFLRGSRANGLSPDFHHGWVSAGLLLAAWAALAYLISVVVFIRRDLD